MMDYPSNTVARPRRNVTDLLSSYAFTHARAPLFSYSISITLQYDARKIKLLIKQVVIN